MKALGLEGTKLVGSSKGGAAGTEGRVGGGEAGTERRLGCGGTWLLLRRLLCDRSCS